uniref:EF-hand domain-containing protein n=1 Tax=Brugia timori TaxID=42155 RepID=A0A0R3RBT3_9BILA
LVAGIATVDIAGLDTLFFTSGNRLDELFTEADINGGDSVEDVERFKLILSSSTSFVLVLVLLADDVEEIVAVLIVVGNCPIIVPDTSSSLCSFPFSAFEAEVVARLMQSYNLLIFQISRKERPRR